MFPPITILYDPNLEISEVKGIAKHLEETYNVEIKELKECKLDNKTYNKKRDQFDGQKLLNMLIDKKNLRFFFWIVTKDLYVPVMDFIFGLASKFYGAIVSFHRLETREMRIKESIHECGHILGLEHCQNFCVMQYSNSLNEAKEKPSFLCKNCQEIIIKSKENFD